MVDKVRTIAASEFKAKCLALLDEVAERRITRITLTKHGKTVAIVTPPEPPAKAASIYGAMRNAIFIPKGLDATEPALETVPDAARGRLRR